MSEKLPTHVDMELSGNCRKCRDGGTGPICSHCQLYHDLELYRQHFLGIEKTVSGKNWNMEEAIDDNDETQAVVGAAKDSAAGLSAAKKLLRAQHQRLGALDELVMACSQLRLRQADEKVVSSKAERLYKLEREEVPLRTLKLEADRAVADVNRRENMAQLRYLVQLQREASDRESKPALATTNARPSSPESTQPTCPVCLEKLTEQRAVLPCAHVYCMNCSSSLTGRQHTKRSVRCPTCRRVWSFDSVTLVVDG
ncbi:hypothetical protein PsorP6_005777 [Peronosclerospora sorghi]|uniref:Uncharacterized protein n=1 Tax=Peronosclerospora sorghi TaxID=230839 RepID=A0ACC0W4S3_9STRA|nr:hypothetical protein PsorP6_005777 [Peronosclerospora sorghi]